MLQEQLIYLKDLFNLEENRQKLIENKLSNLIGQSGLIIALSSLMIPFFYNSIFYVYNFYSIIIIIIFLVGLLSFCLCILKSIKTFDGRNYMYQSGSVSTINNNHKTVDDFIKEQIKDLCSSIEVNIETNNKKFTELIKASKLFSLGIIIIAFLGLLISLNSFNIKKQENTIVISNQLNLEKIEKYLNDLNENIKQSISSEKKLESKTH